MVRFLLIVLLLNVVVFGLGQGWFFVVPDETKMANAVAQPTQFRPNDIVIQGPGRIEHE